MTELSFVLICQLPAIQTMTLDPLWHSKELKAATTRELMGVFDGDGLVFILVWVLSVKKRQDEMTSDFNSWDWVRYFEKHFLIIIIFYI